jgi:hypothetical protein
MRYITALLVITSLSCFVGCGDYREGMQVAPDRGGHAAGEPDKRGGGALSGKPIARAGEMYVTMGPQDTLTSVSKAYGVDLNWLIKRNQLTTPNPKPGTNLIVPARSTGVTPPAK